MIYGVAGSPRSGTSVMMRALLEGSPLEPAYTPGRGARMAELIDNEHYQFNGGEEIYELEMCGHDPYPLAWLPEGVPVERDPESCAGIRERAKRAMWINEHRLPTASELRDPEILAALVGPDSHFCGSMECSMTFLLHPELYDNKLVKIIAPIPMGSPWDRREWCDRWRMPRFEGGYRVVWMLRSYEEVKRSAESARIEIPSNRALYHALLGGTLTDSIEKVEPSVVFLRNLINHPEREFEKLRLDGWPIDPKVCASIIDPDRYRFRGGAACE